MKDYLDRFIEMVKNNTNNFAEFVRLGVLMLMLFEWIHWTEPQMFGFLAFLSAGLALITAKTTVPANRIEQKVDEKVAHREAMVNQSGTGNGLVEPGLGPGTGSGVFKSPTPPVLVLALAGSLLMAGCGEKLPPTTSPEAKIAIRGTQVIEGLRAVLPQIKALTCQPGVPPPVCIPPQAALMVVNNIDLAGDAAIELGRVLIVIDAATDPDAKSKGLTNARMILASIQDLLTKSILVPQGTEIQARLQAIFSTVSALLFTVM